MLMSYRVELDPLGSPRSTGTVISGRDTGIKLYTYSSCSPLLDKVLVVWQRSLNGDIWGNLVSP